MKNFRAVLTGDIVNSSKLGTDDRKKLQNTFSSLSELLLKNFPEDVKYPLSNFRGDSWQAVLDRPENSLKIALLIRSYFKYQFTALEIDSRVAIGIGEVAFVPEENVSAGDGPAYVLSGHLLDTLKEDRMSIEISMQNSGASAALKGMIMLLDQMISHWSDSQNQAIYWSLLGYQQKKIAELWNPAPISQAAVSKNLKSADWRAVKQSLVYFETAILAQFEAIRTNPNE